MTTPSTYMVALQERVKAGVAWLDANRPNWAGKIDLDKLQMASACRCVLGQVDGIYDQTMDRILGTTNDYTSRLNWGTARGFIMSECSWTVNYRVLTDLWRQAILARRAPAEEP